MKHRKEIKMEAYIQNSRFYDFAKYVALVALPGFGAAYFTLAQIWGLPNAEEVVGTVTVVDTLLGVLLGISKKAYDSSDAKYDGILELEDQGDGVKLSVGFLKAEDARELKGAKSLEFKVVEK